MTIRLVVDAKEFTDEYSASTLSYEMLDLVDELVRTEILETPDLLFQDQTFQVDRFPYTVLDPAAIPEEPDATHELTFGWAAWELSTYREDFDLAGSPFTVLGMWEGDGDGARGVFGFSQNEPNRLKVLFC